MYRKQNISSPQTYQFKSDVRVSMPPQMLSEEGGEFSHNLYLVEFFFPSCSCSFCFWILPALCQFLMLIVLAYLCDVKLPSLSTASWKARPDHSWWDVTLVIESKQSNKRTSNPPLPNIHSIKFPLLILVAWNWNKLFAADIQVKTCIHGRLAGTKSWLY